METDTYSEEPKPVPSDAPVVTPKFSDFGLKPDLLKGVEALGFDSPSPIQIQAIPLVLSKRDMIGQAQTGSGKTAAFAIPALQNLKFDKKVRVLVLVPTRELCKQVVTEFSKIGKFMGVKVVDVVGGEGAYRQIELINKGAQVVVATPGRLLDHLSSGKLKNFEPSLVVLDEADQMLDMGFIDDLRQILKFVPEGRQTLLFSATMPHGIMRLANDVLTNPEHVKLATKESIHQDIEQLLFMVRPYERVDALIRLFQAEGPKKAVVFCRTKMDTIDLCDKLVHAGISARALHGDLSQNDRNRNIGNIKAGAAKVLVATDVASRGLDIPELTHVFNFHPPSNYERYTHRIGRTGRAGQKGVAMTLVTPDELSSHFYLKTKHGGEFIKFEKVPSREFVRTRVEENFFKTLEDITPRQADKEFIQKFVDQDKLLEFAEKLFCQLNVSGGIRGNDEIGFTVDEMVRAQTRPSYSRGGGRPNPRGRSGGGYRGGPRRGGGGDSDRGGSSDRGSNGSFSRRRRH